MHIISVTESCCRSFPK